MHVALKNRFGRAIGASLVVLASSISCRFDPSYRDFPDLTSAGCTEGAVECHGAVLQRCDSNQFATIDDCGSRGLMCAPTLKACTPCIPRERACQGHDVLECDDRGQQSTRVATCDDDHGYACRRGGCVQLCDEAARNKSNVGCEYWGVDLDNANLPPEYPDYASSNAAAQQYAIIVSNPQTDLAARVTVEEDIAHVGEPSSLRVVATATVGVRHLEVFKLGPKEVDGSPPDKPNGGTNTALTRGAFRVSSDVPIVAFQFNPLENVNVRSNDATMLLPTASLGSGTGKSYVVLGWPQTIARSEDPATNFGIQLRAFLTLVGTRPDTKVRIKPAANVVPTGPDGPFPLGIAKNTEVEWVLQPFDVLNLETGEFNADFTGSTIETSAPTVVYVGSEASDAPFYTNLADRKCCADHLESQVTPLRAVGKSYVLAGMPNRSRAVAAAGGAIAPFDEPELYRVMAVSAGKTTVKTSLPPPWNVFDLDSEGANVTISAHQPFTLDADKAVLIADVQVSQEAAGIPITGDRLPGGDPSLMFVPPLEQWRSDYVFLTPDKYLFDFVVMTAPFGSTVYLDGLPVDGNLCEIVPGDGLDAKTRGKPNPPYLVYRCQLSFPVILPGVVPPNNLLPGKQNDGVHRVVADAPIGALVYGFDYRVSYAYAAGTELVDVNTN
jgi:hypothetical protein